MKLSDVKDNHFYKIVSFGTLSKDEILYFYEQGIIEGENLKVEHSINTSKSIIIIKIEDNIFAFNKKLANKIEVEENYV